MDLGPRIRRLRRRQHRTLQDVAEACGFTRSLLSKIETGKTVPPVSTLMKIAGALGASVSTLLAETEEPATVYTRSGEIASAKLVATGKGYSFFPFASGLPEKLMQPFLFVARKGGVRPGALSHSGEEFVYVLEGRMRYRVGSVEYELGPGDSLYFDAVEEHDFAPITGEVRYLAVFVEPERAARDGGS